MNACNLVHTRLFAKENDSVLMIFEQIQLIYNGTVHGYICVVMCLFAAITNVINIAVLTRPKMLNSVNVALTGIAASDFGTMSSYVIFSAFYYLNIWPETIRSYGFMCFIVMHMFVTVSLHSTSLWLNVLVAAIRLIILKDTQSNLSDWLRPNRVGIMVVVVSAVITILSVPMLVAYQVEPEDGSNYTVGLTHWAYGNHCALLRSILWIQGIIFKVIPCLILGALIICLVSIVKAAQKRSARLLSKSTTSRRSDRTTILLVSVVSFALITEIPQGIVAVLYGVYPYDVQTLLYPKIADLLDLMGLANSSANFILYYSMSSLYRQTFWRMMLTRPLFVRFCSQTKRHTDRNDNTVCSRDELTSVHHDHAHRITMDKDSASEPALQRLRNCAQQVSGYLTTKLYNGGVAKRLGVGGSHFAVRISSGDSGVDV